MVPALLDCAGARVDVGGLPRFDGLTVRAETDRVVLVGGWSALFAVLTRQARVASGSVRVQGELAERAVAAGAVGVALLDPAAPDRWTVRQVLEASARIAGLARTEARGALDRLGLLSLESRRLGQLQCAERRAVMIAQATLGGPPAIALEAPLSRIEGVWVPYLGELVRRASENRRLLVSVSDVSDTGPEQSLIDTGVEVLLLQTPSQVRRGLPTATAAYWVVVSSGGSRLLEELAARGLPAEVVSRSGDAMRIVVQASETGAIVEAAVQAEAPILELVPSG
jgi:ABC-type Na+ transport system ATPase subunit NatA